MPYKKKYRKRKRPYKRRRRNNYSLSKQMGNSPIANRQIVKMNYVEQIAIDTTVGFVGSYIYSAGNINDPNFSGTGHQPQGHDEWQTFYDRFQVLGSKIKVTFWSASDGTAVNAQGIVGILLAPDTTTISAGSPYQWLEYKHSTFKPLNTNNSTDGTVSVYKGYSPKYYYGISKPLSEPDLSALLSSGATGPVKDAFFHLFVMSNSTGGDLGNIRMQIELDYVVMLTEPKSLSIS